MRRKSEVRRIDRRKIPEIFRAVERDDRPVTYYGVLISDDGFNFVCFGTHDGPEAHLKERVLSKGKFNFSRASWEDFQLPATIALSRMKREVKDRELELDAASHRAEFARAKLDELDPREIA